MLEISATTLLCCSHFFSTWGDRMWMFAIGLYLIQLTPTSLKLAAIYGLVRTLIGVILSPVVGDWIDHNSRMKVIRISLALQNMLVVVAAQAILIIIFVELNPTWLLVCQCIIILSSSLADLSSKATQISIEKDWVVVMTNGDKDLLAGTNSILRRIDLTCAILAPVAVGFIMTGISRLGGIIFICSWNFISVIAEYLLLAIVYKRVPQLADKSAEQIGLISKDKDDIIGNESNEKRLINDDEVTATVSVSQMRKPSVFNFLQRFRIFFSGWSLYFKQSIAFAGLSLAFLYLTVLGFSAITTGYAYTQKLTEAAVSICFGLASLFGIVGTFLYPKVRKLVGLEKTGLISFFIQISMLSLCVVAIWLPGSPSLLYSNRYIETPCVVVSNSSLNNYTNFIQSSVFTAVDISNNRAAPIFKQQPCIENNTFSYWSVSMLMTGLILSRVGLWMTDLTVTQLIQENVLPNERGIFSGTQNAFNSILDLGHYVATIILHRPSDFGYLSLISFAAISLGYVVYIIFYFRFRRRLNSDYEEL